MTRHWKIVACCVLAAGVAGCSSNPEISRYPDLREPAITSPALMTAEDRDAAIADLQNAAASNAAIAR